MSKEFIKTKEMKNLKKYLFVAVLSLIVSVAFSQAPPPPNNGNGNAGGGNTPVGGGAPVGGGVFILIAAAGAYGYGRFKINTPIYEVVE